MSTTITNLPETSKVNGSDYLVLDQPDKTVKSTVSNFLTDTGVVLATQLKDTGSKLVTYKSALSGAIARNIHERLSDYVSVKDFGAIGDGIANDTNAFMAAHAVLRPNQSLFIPLGTYLVNLENWTRGMVSYGAVLQPFDRTKNQIVQLGYNSGGDSWDFVKIEGVAFDGVNKDIVGVSMGGTNPFDGRYIFDDCKFARCSIGFQKVSGNIGNRFINCTFTDSTYHVVAYGSSGQLMHAGCDYFEGCHLDASTNAAVYYKDHSDGIGQLSFRECIFEGNKGFAVFVRITSKVVFAPPVLLDQCWFEANCSSPTVNVDDLPNQTPRDVRLDGVESAVMEGCYLFNIELRDGSKLRASNFRCDNSSGTFTITKDNDSFILGDGVWSNNIAPMDNILCTSILSGRTTAPDSSQNLSVRMPFRSVKLPLAGARGISTPMNSATPTPFYGTGTVNTVPKSGGILGTHVQSLTIPSGYTLQSPDVFSTVGNEYVMASLHWRCVSGDHTKLQAMFGGGDGFLGTAILNAEDPKEWTCTVSAGHFSGVTNARLWLKNNSESEIVLELAELQIRAFNSEGAMLSYINSGGYTTTS